ncbi:MAG: PAS domain S-box protein [Methanospirillum sp.]
MYKNSSLFSGPLRILAVDDDEIVLEASKQYMSTVYSFDIDTARSGAEAMVMIATSHYDAIIADYEMEGMSGLDLLKKLRSSGDETPFIMFTGKGREEVVIASYDNGADGYVQKGGEICSQFAELSHRIRSIIWKKRAEKCLVQSEAQYRQLYEESPLAYITVDNSGKIVRCNKKAGEILGKVVDSLIGMPVLDIYAEQPEGKDRIREIIEEFLNNGVVTDKELVIRREDGTSRWVNVSVQAIRDEQGKILKSNSILQDITERKRAEEALRESEERFRQLFNNASDAIILHEIKAEGRPGRILEVNDSACEMLGYTREEFVSLEVSNLNTPESNALIPTIAPSLLKNHHLTFECTHQRKNGSIVPVEVATHLFHLHDQEVILAICRDITERKHSEKEKEAILSGLKDIVVEYIDREMKIIWGNKATQDAFHLGDSFIGKFCYQIIHGRDSPCPGCTAIKAIETGVFQEGEITTPDGRHWMIRSNPVIENGYVTSVVHLAIDISQRKSAEEALGRSEQRLHDIIDFLPDATFVVDKNGIVIAWNRAIEEMTGIRASDIIGKTNYEYSIPFYGERRPILIDLAMQFDSSISQNYEDFQKEGQKFISESIIANFRGQDVTLWSIASPLFDKSGWFVGAIESIRDISERKRIEDALREARDTLNTVMDSIDALVYVSDMQTHEILFLNEYGKQIWGDAVGKICYLALQCDQDGPCSFCTNHLLLDGDGNPSKTITWEYENSITKRWYQCHDSAIRWIDGRIVRLEIATDISDQKLIEHALRQANRQLNMLTDITRHDILNSINAIQLLLDLMKGKIDVTPALCEFENIEHAISLIQSHIEFTRIYKDLGTHAPVWHHLSGSIQNFSDKYYLDIINSTMDIDIFADPLMAKVFDNLIDNSIRHGQKVTRISLSNLMNGETYILFFEDNGVGIPAHEKNLIFERGYGNNTGFGLFFIREIMSATGISIEETGTPGKGVKFEIHIPKGLWRNHNAAE